MTLCLNADASIFESRNQYISDSSEGKINKYSDFRFQIKKNGCNDIRVSDYILRSFYRYKEPKALIWQISSDTSVIAGHTCQKATTNLGGRQWTAWFSPDIPFSDGPYKFCGLPGLIIKVTDSQNYFSFQLNSLINKEQNINFTVYDEEPTPTTKAKFFKTMLEYRENPLPFIEQGIHITAGKDAIVQSVKNRIEKNNNLIELNAN